MSRAVPFFLLMFAAIVSFAQSAEIHGRIVDASGTAVRGARVELRCAGKVSSTQVSDEGQFSIALVDGAEGCKVSVTAAGLVPQTLGPKNAMKVTLVPKGSEQSVTVTASRTTLATSDLPVTAVEKSKSQLAVEPALTVDDKLRQIPGFALFRRSGSQTANPTSQGVSLRGLGASGASRSLVLSDGVPMNDPFGGWVYWGRVPLEELQQVDVVEGGVSDLYGSNALGGVINLRSNEGLKTAFSGETSYGSMGTPLGSFISSATFGKWAASVAGEAFDTDGYIPVAPDQRGPVDTYANSEHRSADLRLERMFSGHSRAFLRGSLYGESRQNGTVLQVNNATVRQLEAGSDWNDTSAGSFALRMFGGTESLHQTFSSINATRTAEFLTVDQRVPVSQYGFSAQWSRLFGRHMVAAGADFRDVMGDTNEQQYFQGRYSALLIAGGRQQNLGAFVEDVWQITPKWVGSGSLRADRWANADANSRRFPVAGGETLVPFADRSQTAVSPRMGLTRIVSSRVSIYGSAYHSFRAPTLNELYRSFRVGNVVTQANPDLRAEHLTGGELGVRVLATDRLRLRATGFGGTLSDPVGNVTLNVAPTLITRQRQNIGSIRLQGAELAAQARITNNLNVDVSYQFTDATVNDNPSDPTLVGKMTPLVPRNAVTFAATYANPKMVTFSLQGRSNSTEFDDDQNTLPLDPYFNLGVYVARDLTSGLQMFAAVENLLNSTYEIGRTPVPTIGPPRAVRAGVRFQIGALRAKGNQASLRNR